LFDSLIHISKFIFILDLRVQIPRIIKSLMILFLYNERRMKISWEIWTSQQDLIIRCLEYVFTSLHNDSQTLLNQPMS